MSVDVTVPRETKEFLALTVESNGSPTTNFETAVAKWPARPTTWQSAAVLGAEAGVIIENLSVGTYTVWVRVTTAQEAVVVHAGTVIVA